MVGNVVREPLLSAYVGYWVDSRVTGQGVTTAAVALAVDHCLGPVGSAPPRGHRAAGERAPACGCWPSSGFREEGLFRRYLDVDGEWRDHLCFAITTEDLPIGGVAARLVTEGGAERP